MPFGNHQLPRKVEGERDRKFREGEKICLGEIGLRDRQCKRETDRQREGGGGRRRPPNRPCG